MSLLHLALGVLMISGHGAAQTPPNYQPSTAQSINLAFGSNTISPAGEQIARSAVQTAPIVSSNATLSGTYLLLVIEPNPPQPSDGTLPEYVHWIWTGVTQSGANGVLSSTQPPFRAWLPPAPVGILPYIVMLFAQGSNFAIPASFQHFGSGSPTGFNTTTFASQAGLTLVAANYFLVGSTDPTSSAGGSNGTASVTGSTTPGATSVQNGASSVGKGYLGLLVAVAFWMLF